MRSAFKPPVIIFSSPQEIDLAKLAKLELADVYIKQGKLYSPFGAIIASCLTNEEELRLMPPIIKFKPFAWEYEPMQLIRSKAGWKVVKEVEAIKDLKKQLTQALKLLLSVNLIKLDPNQLELAEEFGLASI